MLPKIRPVLGSPQCSFITRPSRFSIAIPNLVRACVWQPPDPKDWYSVGSRNERVNWVTAQDRHDLFHRLDRLALALAFHLHGLQVRGAGARPARTLATWLLFDSCGVCLL